MYATVYTSGSQISIHNQPSHNFSYPEECLLRICSQVISSQGWAQINYGYITFRNFTYKKTIHIFVCVRACVRACVCISRQSERHFFKRTKITPVLVTAGQKFQLQIKGQYEFCALFQYLYSFTPRLLKEPLTTFCEHLCKCNNYKFLFWKQYDSRYDKVKLLAILMTSFSWDEWERRHGSEHSTSQH